MTSQPFPEVGHLVELTDAGRTLGGVRVVQTDEPTVILSMAVAAVPVAGTAVTLRWAAGMRGRHAQDGVVAEVAESRVAIELTGQPWLEQQRNFVRGGGGEPVVMRRPGLADAIGWVRDLSEQAIRAHFADIELAEGDTFTLRVQLEQDVVELTATAVTVGRLRQSVPRHGPVSVETVATFDTDESQSRTIRRYVLRQQMLIRSRTAG